MARLCAQLEAAGARERKRDASEAELRASLAAARAELLSAQGAAHASTANGVDLAAARDAVAAADARARAAESRAAELEASLETERKSASAVRFAALAPPAEERGEVGATGGPTDDGDKLERAALRDATDQLAAAREAASAADGARAQAEARFARELADERERAARAEADMHAARVELQAARVETDAAIAAAETVRADIAERASETTSALQDARAAAAEERLRADASLERCASLERSLAEAAEASGREGADLAEQLGRARAELAEARRVLRLREEQLAQTQTQLALLADKKEVLDAKTRQWKERALAAEKQGVTRSKALQSEGADSLANIAKCRRALEELVDVHRACEQCLLELAPSGGSAGALVSAVAEPMGSL